MTTFKHYTGQQDSTGRLTYTKVNESGEQVFDTLEDIFSDPDFENLVAGL